ncbi:UPF0481 protein At3g47200-like [Eucalyptus grandis]|uniref:UPF0481 protein At3g47200-like n=1 Tax=Eucalyptus grandis TaxID=71139 RepID=UPI00192E837B|nr:UPF0481 protein At3g47200-like [Eucalyptus grandis]
MAAVYSKELFLGWYLITLKLRETVESRFPKKSTYVGEIVPEDEPRPPKSEWVISIEEKLSQGRQDNVPDSWANLSIHRIPRYLKHGEDKDWVPQIVSLGPYHHGGEHLHRMERHKWRSLHRILERSGQGIGLYLDSVKKVERRARACYEGRISMSRDEFVEMMVLDGCFVIEMFQGFAKGFGKLGYAFDDPVFSMQGSILQIQRDMIMLENQIPLFILNQLLCLQFGDPIQEERVAKLALQFFSPLIGIPQTGVTGAARRWLTVYPLDEDHSKRSRSVDKYYSLRLKFDPLHDHGKVHCLEVVRRSLLHLGPKRPKTKRWRQSREPLTFCLSELREDGIQIRPRELHSWGDIQFKNGILAIPPIEIHEGTRSLFLNLIAFEQSQYNCSHYVTSYVIFMHNLINSPEDILYLRDCRIIKHCLMSDTEVADLFHRLCQGVAFDLEDSYLRDIYEDLVMYHSGLFYLFRNLAISNTCYGMIRFGLAFFWGILKAFLTRKWNAWVAILKNKYFDNPWSIISVIAAFVLLVLTFIQAFYAVYAYYRPRF